jgi:HTH-type transcriptional regulator/antitoxin HipB
MDDLQKWLAKKNENPEFKAGYEEELQLAELAVRVALARQKEGLSQRELALRAHVTQQQVSKVEKGVNCNTLTLIRILKALKIRLELAPEAHLA